MTSENYEILIGTYEEFVLGYQLIKSEDEKNKYSLTQTFVTHSHTASVRSVAATSKMAASSGADETVVLYDMVKRKQSGALMQHEGTITCLKFTPEGSHLISCSDDGSIAIFRVGSWQLEKLFKKAHKGTAVNHISIHPSGKLALSVGKDKTLRTWNLVKGRPAYITNLSSYGIAFDNIDTVVWSPEGSMYAIPIQRKAAVFSVAKGGIVHELHSNCKVHCVCFIDETTVVTGNEESMITCYNLSDGSTLWTKKATGSRVKGLNHNESHLIAITSAGDLLVYDVRDASQEPELIASSNDGCRFTCLAIRPPVVSDSSDVNPELSKKKKKKKTALPSPTEDQPEEIDVEPNEGANAKKGGSQCVQIRDQANDPVESDVEEFETVSVRMDGGRKKRKKTIEDDLKVSRMKGKRAKTCLDADVFDEVLETPKRSNAVLDNVQRTKKSVTVSSGGKVTGADKIAAKKSDKTGGRKVAKAGGKEAKAVADLGKAVAKTGTALKGAEKTAGGGTRDGPSPRKTKMAKKQKKKVVYEWRQKTSRVTLPPHLAHFGP